MIPPTVTCLTPYKLDKYSMQVFIVRVHVVVQFRHWSVEDQFQNGFARRYKSTQTGFHNHCEP